MAKRRSSKKKHYSGFPEPSGSEWLVIGNARVWLPATKGQCFKTPSSISDIQEYGSGWAIARSALNCLLQCLGYETRKYKIGWTGRIGEGISKEVYRTRVKIIDGKVQDDLFIAVSLLPDKADEATGLRAIKEQRILEYLHRYPASFLVPEPIGIMRVHWSLPHHIWKAFLWTCGLPKQE
jgi:hypothetical protein